MIADIANVQMGIQIYDPDLLSPRLRMQTEKTCIGGFMSAPQDNDPVMGLQRRTDTACQGFLSFFKGIDIDINGPQILKSLCCFGRRKARQNALDHFGRFSRPDPAFIAANTGLAGKPDERAVPLTFEMVHAPGGGPVFTVVPPCPGLGRNKSHSHSLILVPGFVLLSNLRTEPGK